MSIDEWNARQGSPRNDLYQGHVAAHQSANRCL